VLINHLSTRRVLSSSFSAVEIAANNSGRSHQYAGNSVKDTGDKIKGGAVIDDKSPENEARDFKKDDQVPR
jgi:hypothetical protein